MVKDHHIRAQRPHLGRHVLGLPGPDEKLGLRRPPPAGDDRKDIRPGRSSPHLQLGQILACAFIREINVNQNGLFAAS
jgi:hypothetical protein